MKNQLISIIVPCYNVEKYLPKCIDSILSQTYKNIEIFLIDDGSPDNCGNICDKYSEKDARIKVIHKENGGLSDARNVAINIATGDFITFVDSDDYVAEDYIETLYKLIVKYDADTSITLHNSFLEGTSPTDQKDTLYEKVYTSEGAIIDMFYQKHFDTSAWGKMYKKELFKCGLRYPKGWIFEDLPTTYRLLLRSKTIAFCNRKSYYYLLRSTSIEGGAFNKNKYDSCIRIVDQLETDKFLFSKKLKKATHCRLVSFLFHILLDIPREQSEMKNVLLSKIQKYRLAVLFDPNARNKTRKACLLSFLGARLIELFSKHGHTRQ